MTVHPPDPIARVSHPRGKSERSGRVIAVASGKGGVGKTWLAISLTHALARSGRRVLLFDGDLGLANVDIQLGLMPDADLAALIAGRMTLDEAVASHPAGFDILAGRSGSGALSVLDAASLENVLDELQDAAVRYDAIILDLGAGIDRAVRRMAVFADTLLVVATEEPTSLTDAYAVLKVYASDTKAGGHPNARIVMNQATNRASGDRIYATLARACQTFLGHAPPLAGVIRRDDRVREAIRRQALLLSRHPNSPAATDVESIAAGLGV